MCNIASEKIAFSLHVVNRVAYYVQEGSSFCIRIQLNFCRQLACAGWKIQFKEKYELVHQIKRKKYEVVT